MIKTDKAIQKFGEMITGISDLTGNAQPSTLFLFLTNRFSNLLTEGIDNPRSVAWRKRTHFIIKKLGPAFLPCKQIIENRNYLVNPQANNIQPDCGITLPKEAVIWAPNHGFRDDPLASVLAAKRHSYLLFGSLPAFYNTVDGLTAWANGIVMINRKVKASRVLSMEKAKHTLSLGTDLIMYPEGILNKTPNELVLPLWPGIYRIACETGAKIVPVIHYIRDFDKRGKDNPIHTVIDDPIRIDNLSEKAALSLLRDTLATWFYLMMEVYGKSTRENEINSQDSFVNVWDQHLENLVSLMDYYDREIELCADYRQKEIVRPEQVWKQVATIQNINTDNVLHITFAKQLVENAQKNDFQRRF